MFDFLARLLTVVDSNVVPALYLSQYHLPVAA